MKESDEMRTGEPRVPRARWGGRWLARLSELPETTGETEWTELAEYARTTGYQVARELNLAATLPAGRYEFGVIEREGTSVLVVRRLAEEPAAA